MMADYGLYINLLNIVTDQQPRTIKSLSLSYNE